jgi:hypothetical protein
MYVGKIALTYVHLFEYSSVIILIFSSKMGIFIFFEKYTVIWQLNLNISDTFTIWKWRNLNIFDNFVIVRKITHTS